MNWDKYVSEIIILLVTLGLILGVASAFIQVNYHVSLMYADRMEPEFILGVPFFTCFVVVLLILIWKYYER